MTSGHLNTPPAANAFNGVANNGGIAHDAWLPAVAAGTGVARKGRGYNGVNALITKSGVCVMALRQ